MKPFALIASAGACTLVASPPDALGVTEDAEESFLFWDLDLGCHCAGSRLPGPYRVETCVRRIRLRPGVHFRYK